MDGKVKLLVKIYILTGPASRKTSPKIAGPRKICPSQKYIKALPFRASTGPGRAGYHRLRDEFTGLLPIRGKKLDGAGLQCLLHERIKCKVVINKLPHWRIRAWYHVLRKFICFIADEEVYISSWMGRIESFKARVWVLLNNKVLSTRPLSCVGYKSLFSPWWELKA